MLAFKDRMDKKSKNLNNQLYNLLMAKRSFINATELVTFLIKRLEESGQEYIVDDPLFDAVFESFIITYARPFTVSIPHGKLPNRITNKFNDQRKACHQDLMDKRNKYHAHFDGTVNKIQVVPPGVRINKNIEPSDHASYIFHKEIWKVRRYHFIYDHIQKLTLDIIDELEKLEKLIYPNGMPNKVFELKAL